MKNELLEILKTFYNIKITDYREYKEGIIFYLNGSYYLFTKCYHDEKYLTSILELINYARMNGIKLHDIIYNKEYKLISKEYILLKINVLIDKVDINDVILFSSVDCNSFRDKYVSMEKLWEEKIDYLELQLSEFSSNKLLNNSFDYFVGISEILIGYLRNIYEYKMKVDLRLSHRSLSCLDTIEYYNPLNISLDVKYKDMAFFIRQTSDYNLLFRYIEQSLKDGYLDYFFVRMVFPFKFFDEAENILLDGKDERDLVNIVSKIGDYEAYLGEMEKYFGIYLFSWIEVK